LIEKWVEKYQGTERPATYHRKCLGRIRRELKARHEQITKERAATKI